MAAACESSVEFRRERLRSLLQSKTGGPAEDVPAPDGLQSLCDLLRRSDPRFGWVGFYLVAPGEPGSLVLGPYSGEPTVHVRIPFGRGVCGRAASALETIVVADVSSDPDYLSCSPTVNSEIVVPVFHCGRLAGELDVDSDTPSAFNPGDREFLEEIASLVSGEVMLAASRLSGGTDG